MRQRIYPLFLPQAGCPFQCVYCNQHVVTGAEGFESSQLISYVERRLSILAESARRSSVPGELAFYGGTFTRLPPHVLIPILRMASEAVCGGIFTGIRFSTRPDAVFREICALLADYPIRSVELGVQSFSDEVLSLSCRGYSADRAGEAASLVREREWALGIQLMLGLPGDTPERFMGSVLRVTDLKPDFVRIYPTLVLRGTVLAAWLHKGVYRPLSLKDALEWSVPAFQALYEAGIPLARAGLQSDPELTKAGNVLGGPYHPAFGYLLRVHWWRRRVDERLASLTGGTKEDAEDLTLLVPERLISEAVGPRRINLSYWRKRWGFKTVEVRGDAQLSSTTFECRWH